MTRRKQSPIRIELTAEQQEQVRQLRCQAASVVALGAEALEERVNPGGLISSTPVLGSSLTSSGLSVNPLQYVRIISPCD